MDSQEALPPEVEPKAVDRDAALEHLSRLEVNADVVTRGLHVHDLPDARRDLLEPRFNENHVRLARRCGRRSRRPTIDETAWARCVLCLGAPERWRERDVVMRGGRGKRNAVRVRRRGARLV